MARFCIPVLSVFFAMALAASGALAAEAEGNHRFGDNFFVSGMDVRVGETGVKSVFAAGETVTIATDIGGTAHVAGRRVRFDAPVGGSVYGAGYSVEIEAPVAGGASAAGYDVEVTGKGAIGGDALLAGRYVTIDGPVAGNAMLTGDVVEIGAPIQGSAEIRAREIRFKPGASIGGTLAYWSDKTADIPADVIAADKVTAHIVSSPKASLFADFIAGAIVMLLVFIAIGALLVFVLMPVLAGARATLQRRPWHALLAGVIALSALFGSVVVLAVTLIGLPLVPFVIVLIPLLLAAAYLTSAYALGGVLLERVRVDVGEGRLAALGAIILGLVVLSLLHAIPIFGWLVGVAATLFGLGALTERLLFDRKDAAPVQG